LDGYDLHTIPEVVELTQQDGRGADDLEYFAWADRILLLVIVLWCGLSQEPTDTGSQYGSHQGADNEGITLFWFEFHLETSCHEKNTEFWTGLIA
jgi:hypothetical protein